MYRSPDSLPVVAIVIVAVSSVLVMPAVAAIIAVSVVIAVAITERMPAIIAVMVPVSISVFRQGKSTQDQGQTQKQC
ncbi:MAG TPA: hypothetical protein VNV88_08640 [Candidatus Solibacter sp.]|jgi:hypothetical protein|nr:hypothetical protein [Candidatus Solibacter sp.]